MSDILETTHMIGVIDEMTMTKSKEEVVSFMDKNRSKLHGMYDDVMDFVTKRYESLSEERSNPRITGQEWYDRFKREISGSPRFQNVVDNSNTQFGGIHPILESAKKAAGIE